VIGILNGLDLVDFDRPTLLTHVHSGTLGWITLSVFAATFWLFGGEARGGLPVRALAWVGAVSAPVFALAFYLDDHTLGAVAGSTVGVVIVGVLWWAWAASRQGPLTVPRLSMLAGLATLFVGAIVGVLIEVGDATNREILGAGDTAAHVAAMAFSYLVLVAMGLIEWRLAPSVGLSRAGVVQVALLFFGGLLLSLGSLAGMDLTAIGGVYVLCELVAVCIFVARLWRPVRAIAWRGPGPEPHIGLAAVFVVIDVGILIYLLVAIITGIYGEPGNEDLSALPIWLTFALDHAIFIGVMTNLIFGLVRLLADPADHRWPWADRIILWGTNVGLVGFVAGLALESAGIKRIFSPIMGAAILLGLVVLGMRLWATRSRPQTAPA